MIGMRDEFFTTVTIDLERDADGTLWWQKVVEREAERTIVTELTWTGDAYEHVSRLGTEENRIRVPLSEPVMTATYLPAGIGSKSPAGSTWLASNPDRSAM